MLSRVALSWVRVRLAYTHASVSKDWIRSQSSLVCNSDMSVAAASSVSSPSRAGPSKRLRVHTKPHQVGMLEQLSPAKAESSASCRWPASRTP